MAFDVAGLSLEDHLVSAPSLFRPAEIDHLCGDCSKAVLELGWNRYRTPIREFVRVMVEADMARVREEGRAGTLSRVASAEMAGPLRRV